MTVQELCDKLQTLAHNGHAQSEVKIKILDAWYNIKDGVDSITRTECGDKEWFNVETD